MSAIYPALRSVVGRGESGSVPVEAGRGWAKKASKFDAET